MKFAENGRIELDATDVRILGLLQEDCRTPLARIGEAADLSASAVLERIKKLEAAGVIRGYQAVLDARRLGLDITAFIGVIMSQPRLIANFEREAVALGDVLECHHVTGTYTLLLKVKTHNTACLERLISRIRLLDGVARTETMVVFSTQAERLRLPLPAPEALEAGGRRGRREARSGGQA